MRLFILDFSLILIYWGKLEFTFFFSRIVVVCWFVRGKSSNTCTCAKGKSTLFGCNIMVVDNGSVYWECKPQFYEDILAFG